MSVDVFVQVSKAFQIAVAQGLAAPVTFTHVAKTQNLTTRTVTDGATTTVSGFAVRDEGDPDEYAALGLVESSAATLVFGPTTRGQKPPMGSTVEWEGETWVVKKVYPIAPAGSTLLSRVLVSL